MRKNLLSVLFNLDIVYGNILTLLGISEGFGTSTGDRNGLTVRPVLVPQHVKRNIYR